MLDKSKIAVSEAKIMSEWMKRKGYCQRESQKNISLSCFSSAVTALHQSKRFG
jgi:hypothetical protein